MKILEGVKSLCRFSFARMMIVCAVIAGVVTVSDTAFAQLDLTGVSVDTAPVFTMAVIIITALAAIWAVYKVIGMLRSR